MFSFIHLLFISVLAGRILAFNISVGSLNLTTTEMLAIPDGVIKTACTSDCNTASTNIQRCQDNSTCLCNAENVASLLHCEQCMFNQLIKTNSKADFRVGSQAVLAGYAASCLNASIPLNTNQTALTLPADWDGPFIAVLPMGAVAVVIVTTVILGVSGITLVSTM